MKWINILLLMSLSLAVIADAASLKTKRQILARRTAGRGAEKAKPTPDEQVIRLTAKNFNFSPDVITVKKGEPVVIELTSKDRKHGFYLPDFGIKVEIMPGAIGRARFTPEKVGTFPFACHVFCGEGHEDMTGTLIVKE
jgi:cytochrome c oxidase subunit 2